MTNRTPYIPDITPHDRIVIDYINTLIAVKKISKRELACRLGVSNFKLYNPLLKRYGLNPELKAALFKELGITTADVANLIERMKASNDA